MKLEELFEGRSSSVPVERFESELRHHLFKQGDGKRPPNAWQTKDDIKKDKESAIETYKKYYVKMQGGRVLLQLYAGQIHDYTGAKYKNYNKVDPTSLQIFEDKFSKFCKSYGWAIANVTIDNHDGMEQASFVLLPERDPQSRLSTLPEKLYHITTSENVKSILKKGLIPSSAGVEAIKHESDFGGVFGGMFKNKIFVMNKYTKKAADNAFKNLYKEGTMAVIEIDTSKLPKSIKFFHDETFLDFDDDEIEGYWTKTPIPPEALKVIA